MTTNKPKTIIIGGITGGIGRHLAQILMQDGIRVLGFARDTTRLNQLSSEFPSITTEPCDATDPNALNQYFESAHAHHGPIDAYVHAIGSILIKPAHLTSDEEWLSTIQVNLTTAFYALRATTKQMSRQSSGCCLFFSSTAAQVGIANHEAIAAAKGGIEAMVRSAAATYASRGVRINAIAPTLTDTPLAASMTSNPNMLQFSKKMHPLGDIARPEDIASLAAWLLSDNAQLVTGQTFTLDGGLSSIVLKPKM